MERFFLTGWNFNLLVENMVACLFALLYFFFTYNVQILLVAKFGIIIVLPSSSFYADTAFRAISETDNMIDYSKFFKK